MKILVIGSGAREHALAWKLAQSPGSRLFCAPGNPGTAEVAENVAVRVEDPAEVRSLARSLAAELVVVGPEKPLVLGVADALSADGIPVFGPLAAAAAVEGSKTFAKEIMSSAGVPTADFRVFDSGAEAERFARSRGPMVVKADGLAGGKGVVVARTADETVQAIRSLQGELGGAACRLLLEDVLEGEEVSVIALCDGDRFLLLPPAQDHKRVGEGDTGPNTGGMGAYAPAPFLDALQLEKVGAEIIAPTLRELRRRGMPFRGALYAGLMITTSGPRVLEFNCRLGDPEAQVLLMQIDEDLVPLLIACARGKLTQSNLRIRPGYSVGVVLAAEGYPQAARAGDAIEGLGSSLPDSKIFHAGTLMQSNQCVTAGGRVLTACARGSTLVEARQRAYEAVQRIRFRGMHYRSDIGGRALAAPRQRASAMEKGG